MSSTRTIGRWKVRVICRTEQDKAARIWGLAFRHRDDGREIYFDIPNASGTQADRMLLELDGEDVARITAGYKPGDLFKAPDLTESRMVE